MAGDSKGLEGLRILLAEDQALVAMDLSQVLEDAGAVLRHRSLGEPDHVSRDKNGLEQLASYEKHRMAISFKQGHVDVIAMYRGNPPRFIDEVK